VFNKAEMHFPKICSRFWHLWFIFELLSHNTYYFPPQQKLNEFLSTFSRNCPFQWLFKCSWNLKFSCMAFQGLKVYWRNNIFHIQWGTWMVYLQTPRVFHSLMVLSRDPDTIWRLSAENATLNTSLVWPIKRRVVVPLFKWKRLDKE